MFGKRRPAPVTSTPGSATPMTPIEVPGESAPDYVAPAWIEDFLSHVLPTLGQDTPVIMSLIGLHERLLCSASATGHGSPFLDAAAVIRDLIRSHGDPAVYRDGLDVREDTTRAVAETLRVLRDWTGPATGSDMRRALRQASTWAEHVSLRITAARTTRMAPFATPVAALSPTT